MYGKMQESGLTEIVPLIFTFSYLGPISCIFHILSFSGLTVASGYSLLAAGGQVFFSFLSSLRAHIGGLQSLMTVTFLFTDMAGDILFLNGEA